MVHGRLHAVMEITIHYANSVPYSKMRRLHGKRYKKIWKSGSW